MTVEQLGDGVEAERRHAAVLLHRAARRQGRLGSVGGGVGRFGRRGCRLARRPRGRGGRVAVAEPDEGHDDAVHLAGGVHPEPVDEVPPRLQLGVCQRLFVHAIVRLKWRNFWFTSDSGGRNSNRCVDVYRSTRPFLERIKHMNWKLVRMTTGRF